MRELNYQLKQLCRRNHEGSIATRVARERQLSAIANELYGMGYRQMDTQSLRQKHINALVRLWLERDLNPGTIKNRMSHLRWWAAKINRHAVIARTNDHYGIPDRRFVSERSKATGINTEALNRITDEHVRMSLQLQAAFGLRREEAIKIKPRWAHQGDTLVLKASWTKGGRPRSVPITSPQQQAILTQAKTLVSSGSLIPVERTYIKQLKSYERQTANAGLSRMHGLRHAYAQQRYKTLSGWDCPHRGGISRHQMSNAQKHVDRTARLTISAELGHKREQITAVYLGR